MERDSKIYKTYVEILKRELVPAMGCTEPIAIAFATAKATAVLGTLPEKILVETSGNIIKNVKSVVVPNTNGKRGIATAAAAGAVFGDADAGLQVIAKSSEEDQKKLDEYLKRTEITVKGIDHGYILDIIITVSTDGHIAKVRCALEHTNICHIEKDGEVLFDKPIVEKTSDSLLDYDLLDIKEIVDFAETCELSDVRPMLEQQIKYNVAISDEGLKGNYGANIGRVILTAYGTDNIRVVARASAAAGSDARMNGCEMPVVINAGSGNQGITCSVPVVKFAEKYQTSEENLYRALVISDLVTLHEKEGIGRLSAYCGAVSAGAGAGAGIAWLLSGGDYKYVTHTIVNALAINSGMVCDGAKSSCAAKIAASVDAGILGYEMYKNGQQFRDGEGIVTKGVENTIRNVSRLGRDGMKETDQEIIRIMTEKC